MASNYSEIALDRQPSTLKNNLYSFFERYLSVWVFFCIVAGIGLGRRGAGALRRDPPAPGPPSAG